MDEAISLAKDRRIGRSLIEIKVKRRRKDYFGALKGIGKFTKEDKARGQLD